MVKYGLNTTSGAPSISGQAGALIALLDAYLINGFLGYTPPAGWVKAFTGTNKAVYRSTALGATGFYLRVDDSTALYATVTGYEVMSDVDTGTNAFGTVYWRKSGTADATANPYLFACDEMFMIYAPSWQGVAYNYPGMNYFGDFISDIVADGYKCYLTGDSANNGGYVYQYNLSYAVSALGTAQSGETIARAYSGVVGAVGCGKFVAISGGGYIGAGGMAANPSPANGDRYVFPVKIHESGFFRGTIPGVYGPLHGGAVTGWSTFGGVSGLADRTFINVSQITADSTSKIWVDVTGPWR